MNDNSQGEDTPRNERMSLIFTAINRREIGLRGQELSGGGLPLTEQVMTLPSQMPFVFSAGPREADIEVIHSGTAIYTALPEIESLLDRLGWPERGKTLLDPGAGNGGIVVAALGRLQLPTNDISDAASRVRGYEFHPGAVKEARAAVYAHLLSRGWSPLAAQSAALAIVEERDFLLDPVERGWATAIAANPPYWRLANLPPSYRADYESVVPAHARADLLYAYLQRSADVIAAGGAIGLISADRWLFNAGSSELRRQLGERFTVIDVRRLDASSAFYRPKSRRKHTPPRVHPVSLVLAPGGRGRPLGRDPFRIEPLPSIEGVPLSRIAQIELAPWLGPEGIFLVQSPAGLPAESVIPTVRTKDLDACGTVREIRLWAIVTGPAEPDERILAHLSATMTRMPDRGRRKGAEAGWWLPPETFAGRLPLTSDAVWVPRIARHLRPLRLPAGHLPINHDLIVSSVFGPDRLITMLEAPEVQAQADALAPCIDGGYRSYTAPLLRQLVIPHRLI